MKAGWVGLRIGKTSWINERGSPFFVVIGETVNVFWSWWNGILWCQACEICVKEAMCQPHTRSWALRPSCVSHVVSDLFVCKRRNVCAVL